jgi:hypothetical protein
LFITYLQHFMLQHLSLPLQQSSVGAVGDFDCHRGTRALRLSLMKLLSRLIILSILASLCLFAAPVTARAQQPEARTGKAKEATKEEQADPQRKPYHDAWWTNHHDFLVTKRSKQKEGKEWYMEATKEEKADPQRKPWHDAWWTNHHRFLVTRQEKAKEGKEWNKEPTKEEKTEPPRKP